MNDKIEASTNEATFNETEARILACLMEKQLTTPKNYPLTINSLMLACNQKTNREPVMQLLEGQIGKVINTLADQGYTSIEYGDRSNKIFHKMRGSFSLDQKQQAILAVLMLRKPQTLNDIKTRTARMADFTNTEEIFGILQDFMNREQPLAVCLPKGNGRREDRYTHLLCGEVTVEENTPRSTPARFEQPQHIERRDDLLTRIDELEKRLDALEKDLIPA